MSNTSYLPKLQRQKAAIVSESIVTHGLIYTNVDGLLRLRYWK
jgi:hypothetical protein